MQINSLNTNSANGNYYLNQAQNNANKALEAVVANRAISSTDGASMSIADSLRTQSSSIEQGVANANDAIGVLQIADGALSNITKSADRINELSVSMNSAALNSDQKKMIQNEANALVNSMKDAVSSASFNGKNVFSGSMEFVTGNGNASISLNAPSFGTIDVNNQQSIQDFMSSINSLRSDIGSAQNGIMSGVNVAMNTNVNIQASESNLQNNDIAKNVNDFNQANLLINSGAYASAFNLQNAQNQIANLLR